MASYRKGVEYIALNDEGAEMDPEAMIGMASVHLLATLFDLPLERVAEDVIRFRIKNAQLEEWLQRPADLEVQGEAGIYDVRCTTPRGRRWAEKSLRDRLENEEICGSSDNGNFHVLVVAVEGGDRIRAIVAGAARAKLKVTVNGTDMRGYKS